jgi:non-ribosomal peptide synthetase component E (peptide arylation enzyme)
LEFDSPPVEPCRSVGPQLAIVNESGDEVGRGQIGRIAVQGPPNFHDYEGVEVQIISWLLYPKP